MPPLPNGVLGLVLMLIGGLKTWLHMGSVPVLALPTCTGKTVTIGLAQPGFFDQAHCWGCYAFGAGLGLLLLAMTLQLRERRSVASMVD